jgi:hypothetical protein
MPDAPPTVLVIDDDSDLRASVGRLLRSIGLDVQLFASISDFLKSNPPGSCPILAPRAFDEKAESIVDSHDGTNQIQHPHWYKGGQS